MYGVWPRFRSAQHRTILDSFRRLGVALLALVGDWGDRCIVLDENDEPVAWPVIMI